MRASALAAALFSLSLCGAQGFNAVVTGAGGMLGSSLLHHLQYLEKSCSGATGVYRFKHGDLSTEAGAQELATLAAGTDSHVIHCAARFSGEDVLDQNVRAAQAAVKAAAAAKKRLVFLSSMAAVRGPGQPPREEVGFFTAEDWNVNEDTSSDAAKYQVSKAQAEREAWRLAEALGVEMVSLCPSMIFGPPEDISVCPEAFSVKRVSQWMDGERKIETRLAVDIRDVIQACVACIEKPQAVGKRYIISAEERVAASVVAEHLRKMTYDSSLEADTAFVPPVPLGDKEVDSSPIVQDLGIPPVRDGLEAILAMAAAIIDEEEREAARRLYGVA